MFLRSFVTTSVLLGLTACGGGGGGESAGVTSFAGSPLDTAYAVAASAALGGSPDGRDVSLLTDVDNLPTGRVDYDGVVKIDLVEAYEEKDLTNVMELLGEVDASIDFTQGVYDFSGKAHNFQLRNVNQALIFELIDTGDPALLLNGSPIKSTTAMTGELVIDDGVVYTPTVQAGPEPWLVFGNIVGTLTGGGETFIFRDGDVDLTGAAFKFDDTGETYVAGSVVGTIMTDDPRTFYFVQGPYFGSDGSSNYQGDRQDGAFLIAEQGAIPAIDQLK